MSRLVHRGVDKKLYLYSVDIEDAYTGYWGFLGDEIKKFLRGDRERPIIHWGVGEGTVALVLYDYGYKNHYGVDTRDWDEAYTGVRKITKPQAIAFPYALHVFDAFVGMEEQEKETSELLRIWGHDVFKHVIVEDYKKEEIWLYTKKRDQLLWEKWKAAAPESAEIRR